jgi:hypothetical protein
VDVSKFTGAGYEYNYRQVSTIPEPTVASYCASLRRRFRALRPESEAAEQWIARTYIAVKYLLAASVMLTSAEFAAERNLRIVEPYLGYYSLFNVSRALFLMIPEQAWNHGRILKETTHTKVQNVVTDQLRTLSPAVSEDYQKTSGRALATRELLSYGFPAQGLKGELSSVAVKLDETIELCQFVAETAQLSSECLESEFRDIPETEFPSYSESLSRFYEYELRTLGDSVIDDEDYYRLGQFIRHSSKPWSLHLTGREGLVEDFFGAWAAENDEDIPDQYNPDANWRIIFDFQ